jgi:predicted enzyme related to lactoylglutathione lyase
MPVGPLGTCQLVATGEADAGGLMARQGPVTQPTWLCYFTLEAISKVPGGIFVCPCLDPEGAAFALVA